MALISSGGGRLKPHVPKGLFGKVGLGASHTTSGVSSAIRHAPPKIKPMKRIAPPKHNPVLDALTPKTASSAAASGTQDPFAFIKGLLQTTDPTQARAIVDQVYAPLRQQIMDQIAQIDGMAQARADQMSKIYGEFAQYMQGMPGAIEGIYGKGSASYNAGAAAGGAMAGPAGAVTDHLNAASQIDQGMNDAIGKSWASYAAALPGIYSLAATENIKQMLGDAQANEQKLREDLLSLSSKEASDILDYLDNARQNDTALQEWAYGQKQSQDQAAAANATSLANAKAKSSQDYLDYLQKQRQIDFNNSIVLGKLNVAQAKAKADAAYKRNLLMLKQQGLITDAQYKAAQIQIGQGKLKVAQKNANTAAQRAATAARNANKPKGTGADKQLGSAQSHIQTDISTRAFTNLNQAITYYLNMYGGLVRAGYRAQIIKYVRQAWATKVPKKTKTTSKHGGKKPPPPA